MFLSPWFHDCKDDHIAESKKTKKDKSKKGKSNKGKSKASFKRCNKSKSKPNGDSDQDSVEASVIINHSSLLSLLSFIHSCFEQ